MTIGNVDFGSWLRGGAGLPSTQWSLRAQIEWNHILDKQTDVELRRRGTNLAPQTVRVEYDDSMQRAGSELGPGTMRRVMIFGVHGHPTVADTDIEEWDTFVMHGTEYTVMSVNRHLIGQVQAYAEAVG